MRTRYTTKQVAVSSSTAVGNWFGWIIISHSIPGDAHKDGVVENPQMSMDDMMDLVDDTIERLLERLQSIQIDYYPSLRIVFSFTLSPAWD